MPCSDWLTWLKPLANSSKKGWNFCCAAGVL